MPKANDRPDREKATKRKSSKRVGRRRGGVRRTTVDAPAPSVPHPEQRVLPASAAEAGRLRPRLMPWDHFPSLRHTLPPGETVGPKHAVGLLFGMNRPKDEEAGEPFPFAWLKDSGLSLHKNSTVVAPGLSFEAKSYRIETLLGDEIWGWSTPPQTWQKLAGRAGQMVVRGGMVIGVRITRRN